MRYIVSDDLMKALERYIIETIGIPSIVLMEKAALAVRDAVMDIVSPKDKVLVVCGVGNNGADGLAVARLLHDRGISCVISVIGNKEKATAEWKLQYDILKRLFDVQEVTTEKYIEYNVIVDALFGIGLSREVTGVYKETIDAINTAVIDSDNNIKVVAIDVPSGINAGNAKVMGEVAVKADKTITFEYEKIGLRMYPGAMYAGKVEIANIGIPVINESGIVPEIYTHTLEDYSLLPERRSYSNKGSYGKVLIIAGAKNMAGAAIFSALTAYRMGAGLVYILTAPENRTIIQKKLPEAVLIDIDDKPITEALIAKYAKGMDSVVCGPGLGMGTWAVDLVKAVLKLKNKAVILDADALNIIASERLHEELGNNMILTPHLGEMVRLLGVKISDIQNNLIKVAEDFAREKDVTLVLKDAVTVIADKEGAFYLNSSGNNGMSTAGSGDVLTGVLGALAAMYTALDRHGIINREAISVQRLTASLAVYIHGLAGDYAKKKMGERPLLSRDICKSVEKIMGEKEWKELF